MKLRHLLLVGAALIGLSVPAFAASPILSYSETATSPGTTAVTTTDSASFAVNSGNTLVALIDSCGGSATCGGTSTTRVSTLLMKSGTGTLGTCQVATGAKAGGSGVADDAEIWYCPVTASGTMVVEATWGAGVYWGNIALVQVAGTLTDDGKGNYASGTGTAPSVATNGNTSVANELIVASAYPSNTAVGGTAGTGYAFFSGSIYNEYSTTNSAGANTAAVSFSNNGPNPWGEAIAAFKFAVSPVSVTFGSSAPQLADTALSGATITSFVVNMSDSSTYSGTNSIDHTSDALCAVPASNNGNLTLSRNLASTDVGNHTCVMQATENGVSILANVTFTVSKAVSFSDSTALLPGTVANQVLGAVNGQWALTPALAGPAGPPGPPGAPGQNGTNAGQMGLFTPTGSTMTCTQGQSGFDQSYLYLCINTNQWGRFSLSGLQTTGW